MTPVRTLIISSAYLKHSNIASYLARDGRYDVVIINENEIRGNVIFGRKNIGDAPLLVIVEWNRNSNKEIYYNILCECEKHDIKILVIVPKKDLKFYLEQKSSCVKEFVLIPLNETELCARVAMVLGKRPSSMPPGYTYIDDHLAINFNERVVRLGENQYIDLIISDALFLRHLYDNINYWVDIKSLDATAIGMGNLKGTLSDRFFRLKKKIEDNIKYPRYLKQYSSGVYMLYSDEYPPGDPLIGFDKLKRQYKGAKSKFL